jgi:transposase
LKQVVVQLITSHRSALPVWLEVLSGNSSDKESFTPAVAAYCAQLEGAEQPCFVMDSAGYAEDNLKSLGETRWLMRVPETLKEAKRLVQETEQESMTTLAEGYWGREFRSDYAGVAQRWLVVFSQAAYARELKTLERKQARELAAAEKGWRKLSRQDFNCEADADQAVEQFNRRWQYHQVAAQIIPQRQYLRRGRPAAEEQPEVVGYQLSGEVQVAPAGVALARRSLGKFILTTNQPDAERLPAAEMLANYTAQGVSVERGFRFLKDPLFFAHSLFLKKPERIMALVMIMGLALLIFALAEHRLRAALRENDETLPDQKGKPTSNPTLRWVFQIFEGLDVLSVSVSGRQVLRQVLNLKPVHHQVLQLLGPQVKRCYLLAA